MARTRNPIREASPDFDSDSDVPEEIGASQAKTRAQASEAALRSFEEGERTKRKEKNRKKDEALKARASKKLAATHGEEDEDEERQMLEERMRKAMDDAEESPAGSEDEQEFMALVEEMKDETDEIGNENADSSQDSMSDEDAMDADDSDELLASSSHLPDHLFASLGQGSHPPISSSSKSKNKSSEEPLKRRKRRQNKQKDVIVGARTIRTLAPSALHAANAAPQHTVPASRVSRFADSALGLRKEKPSKAKWKAKLAQKGGLRSAERNNRIAANVGVMRSSGGPAARFVRAH